MSLEQALQENTAAVNALAALIKGAAVTQEAAPAKATTAKKPTKPATTETAASAADAPASTPAKQEAAAAPAQEAAKTASMPAKDFDRQPSIDALMKVARGKGKAAAVELLGKFKVSKATELPTKEKADEFIAAANAILNPEAGDGSDLI
jgi:hypothetical protein